MNQSIEEHKYNGEWNDGYDYEGLIIHAGKGVHESVFELLKKSTHKNSKILVLGAGTGAFDKRLYNHGFDNITSIDLNTENYQYENPAIDFKTADLNNEFSKTINGKFDLIIAIEIVEHLYSTDTFLRNCRALMSEKSKLIISTPNPRSYMSRWKFFIKGHHSGFEGVPQLYEHVNPIHIDIFRHFCYFNGLHVSSISSIEHKWTGQTKIKKHLSKIFQFFLKLVDSVINKTLKNESKSILLITVNLK